MLFFDFAEGSRNVVLIKVGLFIVAYMVSIAKPLSLRFMALLGVALGLVWFSSGYMLDMRNQGLGNYVAQGSKAEGDSGFMIDNNLVTISRAVTVYPNTYPYPGADIVAQVFTKWIPRALWPNKPTEWANPLESSLNVYGGTTLALSYVGEAYLIAGWPSLIIVSLLIGMASAAWNRVGVAARSNLDLIYYTSGFFAAALGMRSIQFVSIAMVPTVALYLFGRYFVRAKPVTEFAT